MPGYSNKRARAIQTQAIQVFALAGLLAALLALWPASQASAAAGAPCAADIVSRTREAGAAAFGPSCLSHARERSVLHIAEVPQQSFRRSFTAPRIVLTPRRLAANTAPGELGVDLSEDVPVAPALLVRAAWSDASAPETQENPFTLVGNRAGLVNATQTETKGGEVWLTAGDDAAERPGPVQTAAP